MRRSRGAVSHRETIYSTGAHWIVFAPVALAAVSCLFALAVLLLIEPRWSILAIMPLAVCLAASARTAFIYTQFGLTVGKTCCGISTSNLRDEPIELALSGIRGFTLRQTPLGKALGYGDVEIRHAYGCYVFRQVAHPAVFRRHLRDAVVAAKMQSPPIGGAPSESLQNRRLGSAYS